MAEKSALLSKPCGPWKRLVDDGDRCRKETNGWKTSSKIPCSRAIWGLRRPVCSGNPDGRAGGVGARIRKGQARPEIPATPGSVTQDLRRAAHATVFCSPADRETWRREDLSQA